MVPILAILLILGELFILLQLMAQMELNYLGSIRLQVIQFCLIFVLVQIVLVPIT